MNPNSTLRGPRLPSCRGNFQAKYFSKQQYNVDSLEPVVAKPHSPDNKAFAKDCRDTKIDRVYIGSCTGGKTEDFAAAARILQNQKARHGGKHFHLLVSGLVQPD